VSNTVLVASLFPNPFLHASKRAALLAVGFNCRKIEFLSVIKSGEKRNSPPPISSRQSEEDMDSLARSMVEVKTESAAATILYGMCSSARFDFGGLHESACKRANEIAPTLIVIGWQSHPWWPVLHNFNLIHGISRSSLKPVLLVRREPRKSYSHAVFLWDESSALPDMLEVMARLLPYARITIVHAYHLPGEGQMRTAGVRNGAIDMVRDGVEDDIRQGYARILEESGIDRSRFSLTLLPKPAGVSVAHYVETTGADLLILSDRRRWLVDEWCWQSRTRDLMSKTSADILMLDLPRKRIGPRLPERGPTTD